jgi:DNA recombination protein RmuC
MELLVPLLGLVVGLAVGLIVALVLIRARRRQAVPASTQEIVELVLSMTGDKLTDHAAATDQQAQLRNSLVESQVRGMSTELTRVTELVATLQRDRAQQHGELMSRLTETSKESQRLADTTQSLRYALASPKARGQWGERMADDVLRLSGLIEGVNYRRQTGVSGGGIPDVTFLLPGDRVLHMDVKFPIDNYLRALDAASDAEAQAATTGFVRDVRQRIKEVTTRAYIDPDTTVDYVLLFIPNESVYSFIHEHDPAMVDTALAQRVVLCSPFTLFAVLAVIRQAMDAFQVERTGDEILRCLGSFTTQWGKFSDQVDVVAKRLDSTQRAYDDLAGTRRKALQRTIDQVDDLRTRRGLSDPVSDDDAGGPPIRLHSIPEPA